VQDVAPAWNKSVSAENVEQLQGLARSLVKTGNSIVMRFFAGRSARLELLD